MTLNLIDLDRYPIGDLDQGEGAALLEALVSSGLP